MISCFEDNKVAVQLSQNPLSNSISEHISVPYNYLRKLVCQGDTSVNHVRKRCPKSENSWADRPHGSGGTLSPSCDWNEIFHISKCGYHYPG